MVALAVRPLLTELDGLDHHTWRVGVTPQNGNAASDLAMWTEPTTKDGEAAALALERKTARKGCGATSEIKPV